MPRLVLGNFVKFGVIMKKYEFISKDFPHFLHGGDYNPEQWLDTPEIIEEDVRLMKEANCNEMTVGIFSWAAIEKEEGVFDFSWLDLVIERIYENGGRVVLATPSGSRPMWMAEKYPEVMRANFRGERDEFGERHNHCRTSPIYREKVRIINEKLSERYGRHPAVVAWHLSNEYNTGLCLCDNCKKAFRVWLREKYGDIDAVNRAWWTSFWSHTYTSFESVNPPHDGAGESRLHGLNLDWKRFNSDMAVDFARAEAEAIRKYSSIPITTNFMGNYEGFDHYKMAEVLDVVSNDFYPRWHGNVDGMARSTAQIGALLRGLKGGRPFMVMESAPGTNLGGMGFAKLKSEREQFFEAMLYVATGADTVQYFQWRKSRGGWEKFHGAVVDHYGRSDTRIFRSISAVGEALGKLDGVLGMGIKSDVAIIRDYENLWAIDGKCIQTVVKSPLSAAHYDIYDGYFKAAWERGISADVIGFDEDFSKYKVICLSVPYLMNESKAEKIKRFVFEGGTLITTFLTAVADDTDLCYLGGVPGAALSSLFGLRAEEVDDYHGIDTTSKPRLANSVVYKGKSYGVAGIAECIIADGASTLAHFTGNIQKDMPAVLCNDYGKGRAYYIGYQPDNKFLADFMGDVFSELEISAESSVKPLSDGIRTLVREGDGEKYAFVFNTSEECGRVELSAEYTELLSGKRLSSEQTLDALSVLVLKIS